MVSHDDVPHHVSFAAERQVYHAAKVPVGRLSHLYSNCKMLYKLLQRTILRTDMTGAPGSWSLVRILGCRDPWNGQRSCQSS
jgi:hypothetical protein